jgi:short-subunit dehydrogenase
VISAAQLPQLSSVTDIDQRAYNQALTVNVLATQALIASFDPLLRKSENPRVLGLTSGVARKGRAYWSAYASTKAAFEILLESYAEEIRNISKVRVAIVNPGATRTAMRARAYPGEDPASVKPPEEVAKRLVSLLGEQFETGHSESVNQKT